MDDTDTLAVSIDIKNTGSATGSEVVQLYVAQKNPTIFKAAHELKGFEKVVLAPGESKTVSFSLDKRSFAYYNTDIADWHVESGEYEIRAGASSRDIRGSVAVKVNTTVQVPVPNYRDTAPSYYDLKDGIANVPDDQFTAIMGRPLPRREIGKDEPFDATATLKDIQVHWFGRLFSRMFKKQAAKKMSEMSEDIAAMMEHMFDEMPLRSIKMLAGGQMPPNFINGLLTVVNGNFFKGLRQMREK
jgi:beta-glucosidase